MPKRHWNDGALGNTPLKADALNELEEDLEAALLQLARDPGQLFAGTVTRDAAGAPVSATVAWPDGVGGVYSGEASPDFPGAVDSYTVTRTGTPVLTFAQPAVTRDTSGLVVNRPPITVS
ncbi:hypothetical protein QEO74_gp41 [Arthrobacter phage Nandita]|uniref:Uncharacterized protein n=1 Tax=Arthrobacter phage Nandita TaxID=2419963 RepID=A0A3G2KIE4_9CAUD|nr:hypothetical protein QEO74_gp41 [Arthrobacter phage Nandita]AYN58650.1 hypothetical protein PBI_NANDITA_29 [Arthrobacter phage Nandita]